MKQQRAPVIAAIVVGVLLLLLAISSRLLGNLSPSMISNTFWLTVLAAGTWFTIAKALPYLAGTAQLRPTPAIRDVLRTAFQKNYTVRVQRTLQGLPGWPIRPLLSDTAQQLFALKFAAQRAQKERCAHVQWREEAFRLMPPARRRDRRGCRLSLLRAPEAE